MHTNELSSDLHESLEQPNSVCRKSSIRGVVNLDTSE